MPWQVHGGAHFWTAHRIKSYPRQYEVFLALAHGSHHIIACNSFFLPPQGSLGSDRNGEARRGASTVVCSYFLLILPLVIVFHPELWHFRCTEARWKFFAFRFLLLGLNSLFFAQGTGKTYISNFVEKALFGVEGNAYKHVFRG